jgi:hypothetical protein
MFDTPFNMPTQTNYILWMLLKQMQNFRIFNMHNLLQFGPPCSVITSQHQPFIQNHNYMHHLSLSNYKRNGRNSATIKNQQHLSGLVLNNMKLLTQRSKENPSPYHLSYVHTVSNQAHPEQVYNYCSAIIPLNMLQTKRT